MAHFDLVVNKVTSVPSSYGPNEIYYVSKDGTDNSLEIYVTNNDGSKIKRLPNKSDIQSMITTAISNSNSLVVVDNISARDSINPPKGRVYVVDASGDSTVESGGAEYLYNDGSWIKISETESLDLILSWSNIDGKPSSSASQIDNAVNNSHTHANMSQLNKIGEDDHNRLTYGGKVVTKGWNTLDW